MRYGWRVAGLTAAIATMTTACGGSFSGAHVASQSASASSASSASVASVAATAAPGTYGAPVNPSLPNPTNVATDAPVTATPGRNATVVMTYSGWTDATASVEVGALVSGVVESGGTCTLTLTSGVRTATATTRAEPDASSTSCPVLAIRRSELSPGTWSAVVNYKSPSTSGQSKAARVVVP